MSVLVLGVGNILLSDEAIGVRVIEALEQRYLIPEQIEILDGGTAGMELLETMANRQHLIIVDAVLAKQPPGSIMLLRDEQVPVLFTNKISPHQLGLADVLSALRFTNEFPQQLTLIGVVPELLEPNIGLTAVVQDALEGALQQVIEVLAAAGITLIAREEE